MDGGVTFRVLGPLEVVQGGKLVPVGAAKQRIVLAALLLQANRTVSVDELVDKLWDDDAPADARGTVQKYVMRLRRALGAEAGLIHTEPAGYRLSVASGRLDLERFGELGAQAERAARDGDVAEEAQRLAEALGLWRGMPPLANVPSAALQRHEVAGLVERHLQFLERRIDADLVLGEHTAIVGELMVLVRRHPLRERFWAQWLRALHGAGRRGDALAAYREVATLLAEEIGVDPGAELQAAHRAVLGDDGPDNARTAGAADSGGPDVGRWPAVRQLPAAVLGFAGREAELARVTAALTEQNGAVLISGAAGVGKTALALQAAHRIAERFDDGQLFADLRGDTETPLHTEAVLGQFLRALGLAPGSVPLTVDDQVGTYRSLLAGRRVLVVLDNVAGSDEVRALLPGSTDSAVLVTSRNDLAGLMVSPGAYRLGLGALSDEEARALLVCALGAPRVAAEPAAAGELVRLCGGLPLALRVAAAHLRLRGDLSLAEYVEELRDQGPVAALRIEGDERANLAAAFDGSYRLLAAGHRRLLRMLSLVPGPDVTVAAAAALTARDEADTAAGLAALVAGSLLEPLSARRFRMHDLIRAYARSRADDEDPATEQDSARRRLLDHYIGVTDSVVQSMLTTSRLPRAAPAEARTDPGMSLVDLDDDRAALVAAVREMAEHGPHDAAYHLADALGGYFTMRGHAVDWLTVAEAGLAAARRAGNDAAVAAMLNSRGALRYYIGDTRKAADDYHAALETYEQIGSPAAHAVRINLGILAEVNGDLPAAVRHHEAATSAYRDLGDVDLEMRARENLVLALLQSGDLAAAKRANARLAASTLPKAYRRLGIAAMLTQQAGDLRQAAEMMREAAAGAAAGGDQRAELGLRGPIAICYLELGRDHDALVIAETALADGEDPRNASTVLLALAGALCRAGRAEEARERYRAALAGARDARNRAQECDALIGWGEFELGSGNPPRALGLATEAVAIARGASMQLRLVLALAVVAGSRRACGNNGVTEAAEALAIARDAEYPLGEAVALSELAEAHVVAGRAAEAVAAWRRAARIHAAIGSRRGGLVADRLRAAGRAAAVSAETSAGA